MNFLKKVTLLLDKIKEDYEDDSIHINIDEYNVFDMRLVDSVMTPQDFKNLATTGGINAPFDSFAVIGDLKVEAPEGVDVPCVHYMIFSKREVPDGEWTSLTIMEPFDGGVDGGEIPSIMYFESISTKKGVTHGDIEGYYHSTWDEMNLDAINNSQQKESLVSIFIEKMASSIKYINQPTHFVVKDTPTKKAKGKKNAHHNIPMYRVLSKTQVKSLGFLSGEGSPKCPHARRGHYRTIQNKNPEFHDGDSTREIWVKASWIGPDELVKKGSHYRVLYDL